MNEHIKNNYILTASGCELSDKKAEEILCKIRRTEPNVKHFGFRLRYEPAFGEFRELRRLQGVAAEHSGYRAEYNGIITVDLSEYIGHESETNFDLICKFLSDMNDEWQYIFTLNGANKKAINAAVKKILPFVLCSVIEIKDPENKELIDGMCDGITVTREVRKIFAEMLEISDVNTVKAIIGDIKKQYKTIALNRLKEYFFGKEESIYGYLFSEKQTEEIKMKLERVKKYESEI